MKEIKKLKPLTIIVVGMFMTLRMFAAGILTPVNSPDSPLKIMDHHATVIINNGFAMTEVNQTFYNPQSIDMEAIYSFPSSQKRKFI